MKSSLLLIFIFIANAVFTQTLSGIVVDENKKPISFVDVLNKRTSLHTHSDDEGKFLFGDVLVGDTLQFSHISYQGKFVIIRDLSSRLNVILDVNIINLVDVVIRPLKNPMHYITEIDIQMNPVNSSQDVLKSIPGLFIGQHAGGGKAEQMFLRGFDLDHGTDINITVDDIPVNMVSHAHGQGYADLHFVIPETIDQIDFGKGPYFENKGNFNTSGYVNFKTKKKLEHSTLKYEIGQFSTNRLLGMFNLIDQFNHNAYLATEFLMTDGPFNSPQNFNRINIFGKYSGSISDHDRFGVTLSHFSSNWDASGQIPQRAIDGNLISRFGFIDDTEGGMTSRSNFLLNYDKIIDENATLKSSLYFSHYDFELYSNFTFFLEDQINGDQIRQKEDRIIYGLNSEYSEAFKTQKMTGSWMAGISLRNDQVMNNELSHTLNRSETLEQIQLGDINETNIGAYLGSIMTFGDFTFNPALRVDFFDFQYNNDLISLYQTQKESQLIASPKFNILYNPSDDLQLFLKTGKGFHSNDTRGVVEKNGNKILPAAYGADLGYIWKPTPKMLVNMAFWYLYLEQEFVYVGDAGIVEASGKMKRQGIDVNYRYQPYSWLYWNFDANYTYARAIGEPSGSDLIPLAPDFTMTNGLNVILENGFYGSVNIHHINNRPANEDNSIVAKGYTVTNLNMGYKINNLNFGIQIQNLFDVKWNEAQFATESRLQNEVESVEEIHFTPGSPRFIKTMVQFYF